MVSWNHCRTLDIVFNHYNFYYWSIIWWRCKINILIIVRWWRIFIPSMHSNGSVCVWIRYILLYIWWVPIWLLLLVGFSCSNQCSARYWLVMGVDQPHYSRQRVDTPQHNRSVNQQSVRCIRCQSSSRCRQNGQNH